MLTEEELIELLKSQLEETERKLEELADLIRSAYEDVISPDIRDQIEDSFKDLKIEL